MMTLVFGFVIMQIRIPFKTRIYSKEDPDVKMSNISYSAGPDGSLTAQWCGKSYRDRRFKGRTDNHRMKRNKAKISESPLRRMSVKGVKAPRFFSPAT